MIELFNAIFQTPWTFLGTAALLMLAMSFVVSCFVVLIVLMGEGEER